MKFPFCKCPLCECDLLLEEKIFSSKDRDLLPKTRYLQAYVKYSKIMKLTEQYKGRVGDSERIRDLLKDCLNDMEMALELKFGKEFRYHWKLKKNDSNENWKRNWKRKKALPNRFWESWMEQLAQIRNHAIHRGTAYKKIGGTGICFLRAECLNGNITETNEEVLPYLEKTLQKIRAKLGITEI